MNEESGARALADRIRQEIETRGPITFARFMERTLYDPEAGYYSRGPTRLGTRGDYFTASDLGPHFGRALARQITEIAAAIAPVGPFPLVECGCGRGWLMRDVLDALRVSAPELLRRVRPILVDRSAAMRTSAGLIVPEAEVLTSLDAVTLESGLVLAVELFDALPAHRVLRRGTTLFEIRVGLGHDGALCEVESPAGPELREWARRYGAAGIDGAQAEVSFAAADALSEILACFARSVVLIFDYGDRAPGLYTGCPQGTLLAYRNHRTRIDLLGDVGEQDLTAHVNFSFLADTARRAGADVLGLTTQDRFLIANGILGVFDPGPATERPGARAAKERLQVLQLIHPSGMGRIFKVLALGNGLRPAPALTGLVDPFSGVPGRESRGAAKFP